MRQFPITQNWLFVIFYQQILSRTRWRLLCLWNAKTKESVQLGKNQNLFGKRADMCLHLIFPKMFWCDVTWFHSFISCLPWGSDHEWRSRFNLALQCFWSSFPFLRSPRNFEQKVTMLSIKKSCKKFVLNCSLIEEDNARLLRMGKQRTLT